MCPTTVAGDKSSTGCLYAAVQITPKPSSRGCSPRNRGPLVLLLLPQPPLPLPACLSVLLSGTPTVYSSPVSSHLSFVCSLTPKSWLIIG